MSGQESRPLGAALVFIPAVWAGMLIGVSLIATPVKFTAPSLEFGPALDVGRVTFTFFSRVEWGAAAALVLAILLARFPAWAVGVASALVACLVAQGAWLLPVLGERVAAVLAGTPEPASVHHTVYGALEAVKLLLLATFAVVAFRKLRPRG